MARGDVKTQILEVLYNTTTAIRPASGESWLVTGIGSTSSGATMTVLIIEQSTGYNRLFYTGNSTAGSGISTPYYGVANGGCKIFVDNLIYLAFKNTTVAYGYGTMIYGIEI